MDNLTTYVSMLTARGMSAIASVALAGAGASDILSAIFRPCRAAESGDHSAVVCRPGQMLHGSIMNGTYVIDEVLVGCEGSQMFVIHCHGNPLLAEQIIQLCRQHGATLTEADAFVLGQCRADSANMIQAEAKLALSQSTTLLGAKILTSQINGGLAEWITQLSPEMDFEELKQQCRQILQRSEIASRIINGVKIVIAGAPNSGKSTLLNALAGDRQVIVSDTAGTTRDWVSVACHLGPIHVEFIDTAGLDEMLAAADDIEHTAQQMTRDLLDSSDLILHLHDVSNDKRQKTEINIHSDKPVIEVFNKCDLVQDYRDTGIQGHTFQIYISAKENIGIDKLIEVILQTLQVNNYLVNEPVVFTPRQYAVLKDLLECDTQSDPKTFLERFSREMMSQQTN